MEQFIEFMHKYFFYIWMVLGVTVVTLFFVKGRKAIQLFADLDLSKFLYSEKNASGYSTRSFRTKLGGSSKVLHVMITDKELIIKTYLLAAYIAQKNDMLHRIPLENIMSTEIKDGTILSKLVIRFKGQQDELKEIVILSKNNCQIKEILDRARIIS